MLTTLLWMLPPNVYRRILNFMNIEIAALHEWAESLCMCEAFNCFDDEEDTDSGHLHTLQL